MRIRYWTLRVQYSIYKSRQGMADARVAASSITCNSAARCSGLGNGLLG